MAARFHRLLRGTDLKRGLLDNLRLSEAEEQTLRSARDDIRACIAAAFRRVGDDTSLRKALMVERGLPPIYRSDAFLARFRPAPKFREQGSHAYGTLNDPVPEYAPPQQVDLDDGVFLPTSFVNGERPALAAKAYFRVVEEAVEPLCHERGWTLCSGEDAKKSCVRIQITPRIHVDLALYALPDEDYEKAVDLAKAMMAQRAADAGTVMFSDEEYVSLPEDHIMLAQRDGSWRRSDPRKLGDWFRDAVRRHGSHLRNVCRYLKAWRDYQWRDPDAGIPSIALMSFAVRVFDENRRVLDSGREDDALLAVAERMPDLLKVRVRNPVVDGEYLDDRWSTEERGAFVARAAALRDDLAAAADATRADAVVARLRARLGGRVPADLDLIDILPSQEAAVLSQPRVFTPAPVVGRSVSG